MRRLLLPLLLAACSDGVTEEVVEFSLEDAWPQRSLLPAATGPRLVVTNSGDDTLSLIDATSFTEIARIPVGIYPMEVEGPHHVAVSPDGRTFFVGISNTLPPNVSAGGPHGSHGTGTAAGYLLRIDAQTGRLTGRIRADRSPGDVRLQPGGARVWQSHYDLVTFAQFVQMGGRPLDAKSVVTVTDAATFTPVARIDICPAGHGIGFAADGSRAYVSCSMSDELAIIDTTTFEVARVPVGPDADAQDVTRIRYEPYAVTVAPDGRVWVSNTALARPTYRGLRVIDPVAREELPELALSLEGIPLFGEFTDAGDALYLVTQDPDRLLRIDPSVPSIAEEIDLAPYDCLNAHAAVLSPDETELWIVCEGDRINPNGRLLRFDVPALGAPTGSVRLGVFPDDVAFVPFAEEAK